jgi:sugar lactone lactonase YvrE
MAATSAELQGPAGVMVDAMGRLLIADSQNNRIRRVELDDTIVTVAGNGGFGYNGDNIAATSAQLGLPAAVAVDAQGRIVISDALYRRVRRIELDNTITTIAGTGIEGFAGDGGLATSALLGLPVGIAVDPTGQVVFADPQNQRVRRVGTDGIIATAAGTGTFGFGGDATEATGSLLYDPFSVEVDAMGRVYISDTFHHCVRRVELDGSIVIVAGTGVGGFSGDNGPATSAQLNLPNGIRIDGQGRLLITDTFNHRIRRVDANGVITTIAGTGVAGTSADGLLATLTKLSNPNDVAVDSSGRVLIADTYNSAIKRIKADNTIETIAGTGAAGYDGDGLVATASRLAFPYNLSVDGMGRVLISDTANQRIRRIELDNTLVNIAGNGINGQGADGLAPLATALDGPQTVHVDSMGRVLFIDGQNHVIRRLEANNTLSVIVGTIGANGSRGDGGSAVGSLLNNPHGFAIDSQDRIYIADTNNKHVRRVTSGVITTIAGRIDPESVGPSTRARLEDPQAIAVGPSFTLVAAGASGTLEAIRNGRVEVIAGHYPQDLATSTLARYRTNTFGSVGGTAIDPVSGTIYLTESSSNRLHAITQTNPADPKTWTIAALANAAGIAGFADGAAGTARFRAPTGVYLDAQARILYIADTGNHAVRALDLNTNMVTTIANASHSLGFSGDGGAATAAQLFGPSAVTRCTNGDMFIADSSNNRVRRIVAGGTISTVLGDGVPASSGEGSPARTFPVDRPRGLACDAFGNLYVTSSTTVRLLTANDMGIVDGSGGVETIYGEPPRDEFPASVTSCLTGLAVTGANTLQIADACTGLLVQLTRAHVP